MEILVDRLAPGTGTLTQRDAKLWAHRVEMPGLLVIGLRRNA